MAQTENKKITTLSPETARTIARYVAQQVGKSPRPFSNVKNFQVSQTHTFAKITGNATVGGAVLHSWKEVRFDIATKLWVDAPDGRSGTTSDNYVVNAADATVEIPQDTIVEVRKCEDPETRKSFWVGGSSASLPTGQYQFMNYTMVTNNQAGFDFTRLHPPLV